MCMQGVHRRLQGVRDRVLKLKSREGWHDSVTRDRRGWRTVTRSVKSFTKSKCGWKSVARHAQAKNLTKSRRDCSRGTNQRRKSQEEERQKYSREEVPRVFTERQ
jgi:hypothetical protein